jgi:hypothetical protein
MARLHRLHAASVFHLQRRCPVPGAVRAIHRSLARARHREDAKHEHQRPHRWTQR